MKSGYGMFMAMAAAMGAFSGNYGKRKDELSGVDIVAEYELIQQKKSRLSRRLRDRVCYIIVAEYELIQQKKSRLSRRLRDRVCYIYENRES